MPDIRQLSPSVINKIAAGEVIERPASVVKELVENSVDAGATRVDVTIEQGGAQLIRVTDNGCGIAADQLTLALASHATSKIRDAEDLFRVTSLGFRGEALASIAEISILRIVSRTAEQSSGAELEVLGGQFGSVVPCGCPTGTTIEVRNLFCNTPVRRKFLRTTQTELGHVTEALLRVALPQPHIHFTLRHNDRLVHDLPPVENWRERIINCFGPELGENLIWVERREDDCSLMGYVGDPSCNRANNRLQYLFLNGRFIRDRALQHALSEAYRGLLMQGRFPVAFLRWQLSPELVDVNVHPTKMEVRFQDGAKIYSQTLATLRNKFLASDLTARIRSGPADSAPAAASDQHTTTAIGRSAVSWARGVVSPSGPEPRPSSLPLSYDPARPMPDALVGRTASEGGGNYAPATTANMTRSDHASHIALPPQTSTAPPVTAHTSAAQPADDKPFANVTDFAGAANADSAVGHNAPHHAAQHHVHAAHRPRHGLQIHNRYLVAENEEGLMIIDQHALHERVLYERLRERILSGSLETQRLLVPEPVTLSPSEAGVVLDHCEQLARLGIHIEPFGGDTVLVVAYPAMLANLNPGDVLRHAVQLLLSGVGNAERRDLLDELLHMMACKAAVKAGDRLSPEEVTALLEHRELCQDAHHCPHGRPTALVFSREELDKRFKRT